MPYEVAGKCVPQKGLDALSLGAIKELENVCEQSEPLHLKLSWSMLEHRDANEMNDILYYDGEKLVGFLGLYAVGNGTDEIEITGMVHPEYRRRGLFTEMFSEALLECRRRKAKKVLLITEKGCASGAEFAKNAGLRFEHIEYGMKCEKSDWKMHSNVELIFRKATNRDLKELSFIDMMAFGGTQKQAEGYYEQPILNDYYIAEADGRPVGKICVSHELGEGHAFGLAVSPNFRGRGYGREILDYALDMVFSDGGTEVTLEVDDTNEVALSLYCSCGFHTITEYDYYEMLL